MEQLPQVKESVELKTITEDKNLTISSDEVNVVCSIVQKHDP